MADQRGRVCGHQVMGLMCWSSLVEAQIDVIVYLYNSYNQDLVLIGCLHLCSWSWRLCMNAFHWSLVHPLSNRHSARIMAYWTWCYHSGCVLVNTPMCQGTCKVTFFDTRSCWLTPGGSPCPMEPSLPWSSQWRPRSPVTQVHCLQCIPIPSFPACNTGVGFGLEPKLRSELARAWYQLSREDLNRLLPMPCSLAVLLWNCSKPYCCIDILIPGKYG